MVIISCEEFAFGGKGLESHWTGAEGGKGVVALGDP